MVSPKIAAEALRHGMALLEEQRDAMLARDADALSVANDRLSDWLHALRVAFPSQERTQAQAQSMPQAASTADPEHVRELKASLGGNALLAQRCASRAARALETLLPSSRGTYTHEGRASTSLPRREGITA